MHLHKSCDGACNTLSNWLVADIISIYFTFLYKILSFSFRSIIPKSGNCICWIVLYLVSQLIYMICILITCTYMCTRSGTTDWPIDRQTDSLGTRISMRYNLVYASTILKENRQTESKNKLQPYNHLMSFHPFLSRARLILHMFPILLIFLCTYKCIFWNIINITCV